MAFKGHNRQGYCQITETAAADGTVTETLGNGVITSHVVKFGGSQKRDSSDLYAGDRMEESEDGAISADVSIDISQLELKDEAALGGHTYTEENGLQIKDTDSAPFVRYAAIGVGKKQGKDFFRLVMYYRVRFSGASDDFESKNNGVNWKTHALSGTATVNCDGKLADKKDFDTFSAAETAMKTFLNIKEVA